MTTPAPGLEHFDAVVLLGFGGPNEPAQIRAFIDRVVEGRRIPDERYESVVKHYLDIGGRSPYNELTQRQADGVAALLRAQGIVLPVEVAYRNAAPFMDDVVESLKQRGARRTFCIVLAPHQGSVSFEKYVSCWEQAREKAGTQAPLARYIAPYYDHPLFVEAHAQRIKDALGRLQRDSFDGVELIFTAHSIPTSVPGTAVYVEQFMRSAELIACALGVDRWSIGYQSRSGGPGDPWLDPDVRDVIEALPSRDVRETIVIPIGFLCDHVEILYDLDIEAKDVARAAGVRMERAESLNDHPLFLQMLAELTIDGMRRQDNAG